jgi:hypothetical protein
LENILNPQHTNILAAVNGAQLAASDGYRHFYFETDSLLLKERMEQSDVDQSSVCISMAELNDFLSQNFDFCSFSLQTKLLTE